MNTDEIKQIVDAIIKKEAEEKDLKKVDSFVTDKDTVTLTIKTGIKGDVSFTVSSIELKKLLAKEIAGRDTTLEKADLKTKVK